MLGDPLVVDGVLVGIASVHNDCSKEDKPAVYTEISHFAEFIDYALPYEFPFPKITTPA